MSEFVNTGTVGDAPVSDKPSGTTTVQFEGVQSLASEIPAWAREMFNSLRGDIAAAHSRIDLLMHDPAVTDGALAADGNPALSQHPIC